MLRKDGAFNLDGEPLKRKSLLQSDKNWIVDLKKQIKVLQLRKF